MLFADRCRFLAMEVVMASNPNQRQMSFTLSRGGLKPDHYIPVRLRFADTLSIASGIPLIILIMVCWFKVVPFLVSVVPVALAQNHFLCYLLVMVPSFLLCYLAIGRFWTWSLRFVFRIIGLLSTEEAVHVPLVTDKRRCDPWPAAWQRAVERESESVGE